MAGQLAIRQLTSTQSQLEFVEEPPPTERRLTVRKRWIVSAMQILHARGAHTMSWSTLWRPFCSVSVKQTISSGRQYLHSAGQCRKQTRIIQILRQQYESGTGAEPSAGPHCKPAIAKRIPAIVCANSLAFICSPIMKSNKGRRLKLVNLLFLLFLTKSRF